MIAKIETGNGFGGSVNYDLRVGLEIPLEGKVLMLSGVEFDLEKFNEKGILEVDPRQVGRDFRFQALRRPRVRKPVYHWVLSWKSGEPVTDEQMKEAARKFMRRMGFVNTQYIITRHDDKENIHCHIILNIVNNDGQRISTHRMIDKCHRVAKEITEEMGFAWGKKATEQSIKTAHKPHERAAVVVRSAVDECKAKATSHEELKQLLEAQGIQYVYTVAKDGKRGRASFAVTYEGQLHTFKGSDVKNPFGKINAKIEANQTKYQAALDAVELHKAAYAVTNPLCNDLGKLYKDTFALYTEAKMAHLDVAKETDEAAIKANNAWESYMQHYNEKQETKDELVEAAGAMLIALNPLVGLMVMLLAMIAADIDKNQSREQKRKLLSKLDACRTDLQFLEAKKAELKIEKQEKLAKYLLARNQFNEYKEHMNNIDTKTKSIKKSLEAQPKKINGPKL